MEDSILSISVNTENAPHSNSLIWASGNFKNAHKITEKYEYSATNFKKGKRSNLSAKGVATIILDVDDGQTLEEGIETFKEFKSLIVTTKSHQVDKKGLVADRYRVILPLNHTIIDMNYYSSLMRVLTRFYNADIACSDPARYYSPNPNQKVYYSNSNKFFEVNKFDEMIHKSEEKVFADTFSSDVLFEKSKSNAVQKRVDLDLNTKIAYYQYGIKAINTLDYIIKNIKVSSSAVPCHCFLNPKHEDKNPSCFIYLNTNNVYAKCLSCSVDGLLFKEIK